MFRLIVAVVLLCPAIGYCQSAAERESPEFWLGRTDRESYLYNRDADKDQQIADLILAAKSFRTKAGWTQALDGIERLPDEKANFHLDIFADMAWRYAKIGALDAAREAYDRARDSPVARAPSSQGLILLAKLRIDVAEKNFGAAVKDIQNAPEKDRATQYDWLEDQAIAARKPDIALRCLFGHAHFLDFDRSRTEVAAIRAIDKYRFIVETGNTATARWRAACEPVGARAIAYAEIASYEFHHNDPQYVEDNKQAVASVMAGQDIADALMVTDLFAIENNMEGARACADAAASSRIVFLRSSIYDYYYFMAKLRLLARQYDEAEDCTKQSIATGHRYLSGKLARHRLESGDISGTLKMLDDCDDSGLALDVARQCAEKHQMDLVARWINDEHHDPELIICACCGAAAGLSQPPTTRPQ